MIRLVPMRYKGVSWRHNPKTLSFECRKQISENKAPMGISYIQDMGRKNMVIKGEGELFGEDCLAQFDELLRLFRQGGEGVLAISGLKPVYAVFESVKIIAQPKPDILSYSFCFREVMEKNTEEKLTRHTACDGETMWDISYKYGIVIDRLMRLNPSVRRADDNLSGRVIRLC